MDIRREVRLRVRSPAPGALACLFLSLMHGWDAYFVEPWELSRLRCLSGGLNYFVVLLLQQSPAFGPDEDLDFDA
ncbi:MAG: hypothetical protein GY772_13290 [bacterium]|nr:hypothetical protein [bacterium]